MRRYNKYIIFLIIAVAFLFKPEGYQSPFYHPLSIYKKSSRNDVSKAFSIKGYKISVEKEKYIERGHAKFSTIKVQKVTTECGNVDVLLSFFNDELVSIKYINFSIKESESNTCMNNLLKGDDIHGGNFSKKIITKEDSIHYDIIFSDNIIDKKIIKWADTWS